ncbi:hypothetical protein [Pseudanabaena yagii]|uniref:YcxB-like protein domain-containing protein n=1 Tax=Pseudanabaena yagii GIHE-NHR1 TaxID=2722753 RepID=A0ABX1LXN6_9CYAN|nr:hypothetical protein [Pseudanabaena yagii]NMF59726.1 hypothetical protein [Pseudanabaena yagii GIHE-NHR1]
MNSQPANKLIFLNTSIVRILAIILSLPLMFFVLCILLYATFGNLIFSLGQLHKASLNCIRYKSEILCSLTGTNWYGNIEQALSPRHEQLIGIRTEISNQDYLTNALIILVTNKKEIFLLTPKTMIKDQTDLLNSFLDNPAQNSVKIETRKSDELNILSASFFGLVYFNLVFGSVTISFLVSIFKNIVDFKKYIFDKESNKILIKKIFRKDLLIEFDFEKINQVHLIRLIKNDEFKGEKIFLIDSYGSILLSINLYGISGSEVADLICSFLQLKPYQMIVPP